MKNIWEYIKYCWDTSSQMTAPQMSQLSSYLFLHDNTAKTECSSEMLLFFFPSWTFDLFFNSGKYSMWLCGSDDVPSAYFSLGLFF